MDGTRSIGQSLRHFEKVAKQPEAEVAALFRVELGTKNAIATADSGGIPAGSTAQ